MVTFPAPSAETLFMVGGLAGAILTGVIATSAVGRLRARRRERDALVRDRKRPFGT